MYVKFEKRNKKHNTHICVDDEYQITIGSWFQNMSRKNAIELMTQINNSLTIVEPDTGNTSAG